MIQDVPHGENGGLRQASNGAATGPNRAHAWGFDGASTRARQALDGESAGPAAPEGRGLRSGEVDEEAPAAGVASLQADCRLVGFASRHYAPPHPRQARLRLGVSA